MKNTISQKIVAAFAWVESASSVNLAIKFLAALCAVLFALDFIIHRHTYAPSEDMMGFYALTGFVSFTFIVLGAKLLRYFILRPENYYAEKAVDSEEYPADQLGDQKTYKPGSDIDWDKEQAR